MVAAPKTELARMELTSQLEETLGTTTARNLMAHIPPINTEQLPTKNDLLALPTKNDLLEFATKNDLALVKDDLTLVKKDIDTIRNEVKTVETNLNSKIERLDTKIDAKTAELNTKMDAGFKEIRSEMVLGFAQQTKKIFTIGLTLALPTWITLIGVLITLVITIST